MEISKALSTNVQALAGGAGVFLPIAASYVRSEEQFGIYFFDLAGARFQGSDYACAGSGSSPAGADSSNSTGCDGLGHLRRFSFT